QDQVGDRPQVTLTLQHAGVLRNVRLQPVLVPVLDRGIGQVPNHLIDLVFEQGDLATGVHPDGSGHVAFGDGSGNLGNRAHLGREVGGQLVDVVGQVLPGPGGARHTRLPPELAFVADLAGDGGDLVGKR